MHAHIVRVFEFHEDQGAAFYSMQYVDGADLSVLAGQPPSDILPAIGLLADALRYAHGKGIVHRDVKASNVLLDYNGAPYLSDFGVAAAAGRNAGGGTPVAASPQAARGEPAQSADDIYALGVLLHELIAGVPPGSGPLVTHDGATPPQDVADLVARMLDEDATVRPDAQGVIEALTAAGYRPGPARSQIAVRPVAEDQRIERIAAIGRERVASASPEPATAAPGLNPRIVGISLAVLVVALLGVVFLLPEAVEDGDHAASGDSVPLGGDSPSVADPLAEDVADDDPLLGNNRVTREFVPENRALENEAIEFNENEADYSGLDDEGKLRFQVESILGELLSDFETLKRRGVDRWAAVPYGRAQELGARDHDRTQHRGLGTRLMKRAEDIAGVEGYDRLAVIASVGTRGWYTRLGYRLEDTYMVRELSRRP
jgi:GNAT superfamily N-acetyltransferase